MAKKKKSSKSKGKKRVEIRYVAAPSVETGLFASIKQLLPESTSEQLLIGLLIGAGASYVLSDEKLRSQIIRYAVQTYGNIAGSFEELKEQVADIQAETVAEQAAAS